MELVIPNFKFRLNGGKCKSLNVHHWSMHGNTQNFWSASYPGSTNCYSRNSSSNLSEKRENFGYWTRCMMGYPSLWLLHLKTKLPWKVIIMTCGSPMGSQWRTKRTQLPHCWHLMLISSQQWVRLRSQTLIIGVPFGHQEGIIDTFLNSSSCGRAGYYQYAIKQ